MDLSTNHFQQYKGFVIENENFPTAKQLLSVKFRSCQDVIVTITTLPEAQHRVRFILAHRTFHQKNLRVLGFTSEQSQEGQFRFAGRCPQGQVFFVPVALRTTCCKISHQRVDRNIRLLAKQDDETVFTQNSEEAAEHLFNILDLNNDWFLSKIEIGVFKECLGYSRTISDEEWTDIIYGWQEGDLDDKNGISQNLFNSLLIRLAERSFDFYENSGGPNSLGFDGTYRPLRRPFKKLSDTEKALWNYFHQFGFDDNLQPSRLTSYKIELSYHRGGISDVKCEKKNRLNTCKILLALTTYLGSKWSLDNSQLEVTVYITNDWCSIALFNYSCDSESVFLDCMESKNIVPFQHGLLGFVWKEDLRPKEEKLVLYFGREKINLEMDIKLKISYMNRDGIFTTVTILPQK